MAQWLKELAATPENPNSVPSTYMMAHKDPATLAAKVLLFYSGLFGHQVCEWDTDICGHKTFIHVTFLKNKLKKITGLKKINSVVH